MIHAERRGPVTIVTIDRPERRNAVDHASLVELAAHLTAARASEPAPRVLVLTGTAGHFCAGADLAGVEGESFGSALRDVLDGLRQLPFPTVAAVDGAALGAGTQLAVACDLRTAAAGARFGIPAARLGLMVDQWTVDRLVRLAGHGAATAMLLAAEVLSGAEARDCGLVQRLADLDDTLAWAEEIAALAPLTIAGHKLALARTERAAAAAEPDTVVSEAFARAWGSADLQEGLAAFRERRPPEFRGE
jgi:enoyl-CoA hydratase